MSSPVASQQLISPQARGDAECYVFERESMSWREVDLGASYPAASTRRPC